MKFERTDIAGLVLVHPERHADERGYFVRTVCESELAEEGLISHFPQSSLSFNAKAGTVRGMHYQVAPNAETKLVRCARGKIFDVVVDLRANERTYLQCRAFELSAENGIALYIPEGLAHGFQTLADDSEVSYSITPSFVPGYSRGVCWDDPAINVRWPQPISVISRRDETWPPLELGGA